MVESVVGANLQFCERHPNFFQRELAFARTTDGTRRCGFALDPDVDSRLS